MESDLFRRFIKPARKGEKNDFLNLTENARIMEIGND